MKVAYYLEKTGFWYYTTQWAYSVTIPTDEYDWIYIDQPRIVILDDNNNIYTVYNSDYKTLVMLYGEGIKVQRVTETENLEQKTTKEAASALNGFNTIIPIKKISKAELILKYPIIANKNKEIESFVERLIAGTTLLYTHNHNKCECGSESVGCLAHSNWCPKH